MNKNNLQIINTGLDQCYINGIPIVEAEIDISDVFKKVARMSSLAVQADPYFNGMSKDQKLFSESHGEGDRITRDFLEEGARDILPIFSPLQRLIPEGSFGTTPVEYEFTGQTADFSWTNPDPASIFVNNIFVKCTVAYGDITYVVDGIVLGTVTLPNGEDPVDEYLAYDLASYLGGAMSTYLNWTDSQNVRNNNMAQVIELLVSESSLNFTFDIKICAVKYNAIGWVKALAAAGDVYLPSFKDDIRIGHLVKEFVWTNKNLVRVNGTTLKHNSGSAYVTIDYNNAPSVERYLDRNSVGDDYFGIPEDITSISVKLRNASADFNYDLIINTELPKIAPSPRFEFDSTTNPGKIIYRYQNMDTRIDKLNYTSETLKDIRVDPNIFDEVLKYVEDSLKNYVLKELYLAIGYDKKAIYYESEYEKSRADAKFWVRSEKGLQTQYNYGGV